MVFTAEQVVVNAEGLKAPLADAVAGKRIILLFYAEWCPDCRAFAPPLKKAYEGNKERDYEIVMVSSDKTEDEMMASMRDNHAGYSAIPFGDEGVRNALKKRFGYCGGREAASLGIAPADRKGGLPTLAEISNDGTVVKMTENADGIADVVA